MSRIHATRTVYYVKLTSVPELIVVILAFKIRQQKVTITMRK